MLALASGVLSVSSSVSRVHRTCSTERKGFALLFVCLVSVRISELVCEVF